MKTRTNISHHILNLTGWKTFHSAVDGGKIVEMMKAHLLMLKQSSLSFPSRQQAACLWLQSPFTSRENNKFPTVEVDELKVSADMESPSHGLANCLLDENKKK